MFKLCVDHSGVNMYTTVAVQWKIYVQCGGHICSVIYVKYVFTIPCCIVDYNDFIYGTYVCTLWILKPKKYLAYFSNLVCTFISGTYLAITYEVCIAVDCVFDIYAKMLGLYAHLAC